LRQREQVAEAEREHQRRKAASARMIAAGRAWQARQAAEVAQVRDAGYCTRCFVDPGTASG
jgi:DNA-binding CsgD family transcriptional regulator